MRKSRSLFVLLFTSVLLATLQVVADSDDDLFEQQADLSNDGDEELTVEELVKIQSDERTAQLAERWSEVVVSLTPDEFNLYAISEPRAYDLYVLVTKEAGCESCAASLERFTAAAQAYWDRIALRRKTLSSLVFFAVVDEHLVKPEQRGSMGEPAFLFVPRTVMPVIQQFTLKQPETFSDVSTFTVEDFAGIIRANSKAEVPLDSDFTEEKLSKILWTLTFILLANYIYQHFDYIRYKSDVWIGLCVFIYIVSTSGFIFCIIRGSPPFYLDGKGNIGFIHPARNNQFIVEGFIAAGLNVGISAAVYALVKYVPTIKDAEERKTSIQTACLAMFLLFANLVIMYRHKAPWYLRFG